MIKIIKFYCFLVAFVSAFNLYAYKDSCNIHHYNPYEMYLYCLAYQGCTLNYMGTDVYKFDLVSYSYFANLIEKAKKQRMMLEYRCQKKAWMVSDKPVKFQFTKVNVENIVFKRDSILPWSNNKKYSIVSKDGVNYAWLIPQIYTIIEENRFNNSVFKINLDALLNKDKYEGFLYLSDVIEIDQCEMQQP